MSKLPALGTLHMHSIVSYWNFTMELHRECGGMDLILKMHINSEGFKMYLINSKTAQIPYYI